MTESYGTSSYRSASSSGADRDLTPDFARTTLLNRDRHRSAFSIGRSSPTSSRRAARGTLLEDPPSTSISVVDVATVAAVTGGVVAVQKKNRRAHLEANGGGSELSNPAISTMQLSLFLSRDGSSHSLLDDLQSLAANADASTPAGLRSIVREATLAVLRAEDDWLSVGGGVQQFAGSGGGRAAATFDTAVQRERAKWTKDTVSNVQRKEKVALTGTAAKKRSSSSSSAALAGPLPTYAVVTLLIGWGSAPASSRQWSASSKDMKVKDRASTRAYLEWLSSAASQGDVRSLELLWTPADPSDNLTQEELETKWPGLRTIGWD